MRLRRVPLVAALLVASALPAARPDRPAAAADPSNGERIAQVQERLGEASRAEVAASARLETLRARRATLDARVAAFDSQIRAAEGRIAARQREAKLLASAQAKLEHRVRRNTQQLHAAQRRFDESAAELYSGNTEAGVAYSSLVLDASSVTEFGTGRAYLEHVADARQVAVDQLQGLRARNVQLRRAADAQRARVEDAQHAAVAERSRLRTLRSQQATQRDAARAAEQRERTVVAQLQDQKVQYSAELAALQATSIQVRSLLYDLQRHEPRASHFHAEHPVPGYITSPFGWRYHPVLHESRLHTGTDFHAGYGSPIHAAAPGRVVWAGVRGGYGNCVVIDHGGQFATLYGHASALYVSVGDHVDTGDTIAAVGSSGLATGPHLHFEVRILGDPVNPAQYF
jgi:murein DD-endopeptidase MepM/ murein hydrolase activator NlpD